jgi:hypothetical protein
MKSIDDESLNEIKREGLLFLEREKEKIELHH